MITGRIIIARSPRRNSQFKRSFRARLDGFLDGLSGDMGAVRVLDDAAAGQVFDILLEAACKAQSTEANDLGAQYMLWLPRRWALGRMEARVEKLIDLDDDSEYRRLLDLLARMGAPLLESVIDRGTRSGNADVREVAADASRRLAVVPPRFERVYVVGGPPVAVTQTDMVG